MYQDLLDRLRLKVEETQMVTVFLSSPFAGMEKERQLFIEQYLPILREMCDAHAVFLKVCDLRFVLLHSPNMILIKMCVLF